jgi:hypothetical protein
MRAFVTLVAAAVLAGVVGALAGDRDACMVHSTKQVCTGKVTKTRKCEPTVDTAVADNKRRAPKGFLCRGALTTPCAKNAECTSILGAGHHCRVAADDGAGAAAVAAGTCYKGAQVLHAACTEELGAPCGGDLGLVCMNVFNDASGVYQRQCEYSELADPRAVAAAVEAKTTTTTSAADRATHESYLASLSSASDAKHGFSVWTDDGYFDPPVKGDRSKSWCKMPAKQRFHIAEERVDLLSSARRGFAVQLGACDDTTAAGRYLAPHGKNKLGYAQTPAYDFGLYARRNPQASFDQESCFVGGVDLTYSANFDDESWHAVPPPLITGAAEQSAAATGTDGVKLKLLQSSIGSRVFTFEPATWRAFGADGALLTSDNLALDSVAAYEVSLAGPRGYNEASAEQWQTLVAQQHKLFGPTQEVVKEMLSEQAKVTSEYEKKVHMTLDESYAIGGAEEDCNWVLSSTSIEGRSEATDALSPYHRKCALAYRAEMRKWVKSSFATSGKPTVEVFQKEYYARKGAVTAEFVPKIIKSLEPLLEAQLKSIVEQKLKVRWMFNSGRVTGYENNEQWVMVRATLDGRSKYGNDNDNFGAASPSLIDADKTLTAVLAAAGVSIDDVAMLAPAASEDREWLESTLKLHLFLKMKSTTARDKLLAAKPADNAAYKGIKCIIDDPKFAGQPWSCSIESIKQMPGFAVKIEGHDDTDRSWYPFLIDEKLGVGSIFAGNGLHSSGFVKDPKLSKTAWALGVQPDLGSSPEWSVHRLLQRSLPNFLPDGLSRAWATEDGSYASSPTKFGGAPRPADKPHKVCLRFKPATPGNTPTDTMAASLDGTYYKQPKPLLKASAWTKFLTLDDVCIPRNFYDAKADVRVNAAGVPVDLKGATMQTKAISAKKYFKKRAYFH